MPRSRPLPPPPTTVRLGSTFALELPLRTAAPLDESDDRETAVPLERLEERLGSLDVEEVLLGCAVRLGARGISGMLGGAIRASEPDDPREELDDPSPEELEPAEPDDPEEPEPPEEPELVVGGSERPTALWAQAHDGTARLTATTMPSANRVDLAMTESSKQALVQLYCQPAQAAMRLISEGLIPGVSPVLALAGGRNYDGKLRRSS